MAAPLKRKIVYLNLNIDNPEHRWFYEYCGMLGRGKISFLVNAAKNAAGVLLNEPKPILSTSPSHSGASVLKTPVEQFPEANAAKEDSNIPNDVQPNSSTSRLSMFDEDQRQSILENGIDIISMSEDRFNEFKDLVIEMGMSVSKAFINSSTII